MIYLIVLHLLEQPELPKEERAIRRANKMKAIKRNKALSHALFGSGEWFESPDEDGVYRRWASGHKHRNCQDGRWAKHSFGGHRRFEKWCRDYYPSLTDERAIERFNEEVKEYFADE